MGDLNCFILITHSDALCRHRVWVKSRCWRTAHPAAHATPWPINSLNTRHKTHTSALKSWFCTNNPRERRKDTDVNIMKQLRSDSVVYSEFLLHMNHSDLSLRPFHIIIAADTSDTLSSSTLRIRSHNTLTDHILTYGPDAAWTRLRHE